MIQEDLHAIWVIVMGSTSVKNFLVKAFLRKVDNFTAVTPFTKVKPRTSAPAYKKIPPKRHLIFGP